MNPREQINAISALTKQIDSKVIELWDLLYKAREFGAAVPVHCLWKDNSTAQKWWKQRSQQALKKIERKQAVAAALAKLTKDERRVLGL
jgi:hypothetical protein